MKNLLTFALCAAVAGSMYGQADAVKSASKLSGKLDKLSEARTLIKGAMDNEQTKNQAETYFTAGKIEFDAFDKGFQAKAINPNDPSADPVAMAGAFRMAVEAGRTAFEAQLAPERAGASATSPLNPFLDSIKELEQ